MSCDLSVEESSATETAGGAGVGKSWNTVSEGEKGNSDWSSQNEGLIS